MINISGDRYWSLIYYAFCLKSGIQDPDRNSYQSLL